MANTAPHESIEQLKPETLNLHRAIVSLIEELEAIDWYYQRAEACTDAELKAILIHNMDEEVEHACMVLEWLRRHVSQFDDMLKTYLFTPGKMTKIEKENAEPIAPERKNELRQWRRTIGDLKPTDA